MNTEVAEWREKAKRILKETNDWDDVDPTAQELLEKAAAYRDPEAVHLLAMIHCGGELNYYPCDCEEFRIGYEWMKSRAESGDPEAQYQYARTQCYATGPNLETAIYYWEKAYEGGVTMAAQELADLYASDSDWGVDYIPDPEKARYWYERARSKDEPSVSDRYGALLYREILQDMTAASTQDQVLELKQSERFAKLVAETKAAAEAGCFCSMMRLAAMMSDGWLGDVDEFGVRSMLLRAEQHGSSAAHACLDDILNGNISAREAIERNRRLIS